MHTIHVVHHFAANVRFDTQALLLLCSSAFSSCFLFLFARLFCARQARESWPVLSPAECPVLRPRRSPRSRGCCPPAQTPASRLIAFTPFPDDAASLTCRAVRSHACRPGCSASRSQFLCQPLQSVPCCSRQRRFDKVLATNLCCRAASAAGMEAAAPILDGSCVSPAPARSMRPQRDSR